MASAFIFWIGLKWPLEAFWGQIQVFYWSKKKVELKKLPTREGQIIYYNVISILNLHFSVKFKI
jgi:hypothetical protein